jgi:hypothetical protein
MWDVFEEERLVPKRNVKEQDEMLMDLSHVSHVRHNRQTEFLRQ